MAFARKFKEKRNNMTISLDKLQNLFKSREEYSVALETVERQIRLLVEGPDAQDSGPALKKARKQRTETGFRNDMQKVTDLQPTGGRRAVRGDSEGPPGDGPADASGSTVDAPVTLSAVCRLILQVMASDTEYSGAEVYQLALDASSTDTDAEGLRQDVRACVSEMVKTGHLVKSGAGRGTVYRRVG